MPFTAVALTVPGTTRNGGSFGGVTRPAIVTITVGGQQMLAVDQKLRFMLAKISSKLFLEPALSPCAIPMATS